MGVWKRLRPSVKKKKINRNPGLLSRQITNRTETAQELIGKDV